MRIWDVSVRRLADNQLRGEHRELHCIWNVMGTNKGYSKHTETLRWVGHRVALFRRHEEQVQEMKRRGWKGHKSPLAGPVNGSGKTPPPITPVKDQIRNLRQRNGLLPESE